MLMTREYVLWCISKARITVNNARGFLEHAARVSVVQYAIDAALLVCEARCLAGCAAVRATAPIAPNRAADETSVVHAFDASNSVGRHAIAHRVFSSFK